MASCFRVRQEILDMILQVSQEKSAPTRNLILSDVSYRILLILLLVKLTLSSLHPVFYYDFYDKVSLYYILYFQILRIDLDEHFGIERRLLGSNLRHIIVDEADTLLDITFSPAVVEIIRRLEVCNDHIYRKIFQTKI